MQNEAKDLKESIKIIRSLQDEIKKLRAQIEKMKRCSNCKKFNENTCEGKRECMFNREKWELWEG